ncbi:MAG: lysoplasmalogenase [Planctomycetia bacterium]|nr:lysoplasmalogenase [Planctomycetia bacterium]
MPRSTQTTHSVGGVPGTSVPVRVLPPSGVLRGLWVTWAALLTAAMVMGHVASSGHAATSATLLRMASSVTLVTAAGVGALHWRGSGAARFMCLIAIGMTLGTLGDFFNAGLLDRIVPLPDPALGGIGSFGLGHIAYIAACLVAAVGLNLRNARVRYGWLAAWLAVATVGWYAIVYLSPQEKTRLLVWPALPYSLLLATTAGLATGLAAQSRTFLLMATGAALFFASDMILAIGLFRGGFAGQTEAVWLTYGPGQMGIVYGALAVCPMLVAVASAAHPQVR